MYRSRIESTNEMLFAAPSWQFVVKPAAGICRPRIIPAATSTFEFFNILSPFNFCALHEAPSWVWTSSASRAPMKHPGSFLPASLHS
jgi:hypothetical protein